MIRAPRTIAIFKRIFMFPITDENRDRTTSLESNYTLIVKKKIKKMVLLYPIINSRISRVWRIKNGFRRKCTIRDKIEGQAKAVSLAPHGVKNA